MNKKRAFWLVWKRGFKALEACHWHLTSWLHHWNILIAPQLFAPNRHHTIKNQLLHDTHTHMQNSHWWSGLNNCHTQCPSTSHKTCILFSTKENQNQKPNPIKPKATALLCKTKWQIWSDCWGSLQISLRQICENPESGFSGLKILTWTRIYQAGFSPSVFGAARLFFTDPWKSLRCVNNGWSRRHF
jgi:hypothetical protein